MVTQVQDTLIKQLHGLNPLWIGEYGIRTVLIGDDEPNKVRLCSRMGRIKVNIDITYNRVSDLYELKAYKLTNHGLDVKLIHEIDELFFDSLHTAIRHALEKACN